MGTAWFRKKEASKSVGAPGMEYDSVMADDDDDDDDDNNNNNNNTFKTRKDGSMTIGH